MANDGIGVTHRQRGAPLSGRTAAAVVASAGLAALAAGCGGSNGGHAAQLGPSAVKGDASSAAASTQTSRALAWARCMRANGVPDIPDPTGPIVKIPTADALGVGSSRLQAAESTCRRLLPNGGEPPNQAEQQQLLRGMLSFSRCLRSHGVSDWPDPTIGREGRPDFDLVGIHGIPDESSPQFQTAMHSCEHLVPKALGGIPVEQPNP
jgi:hypothetical protein